MWTGKVGASYDYLFANEQTSRAGQYANAVAGYITFQATEKLTVNARCEYATGDVSFGGANPFGTGYDSNTGSARSGQRVVATTLTAQYDLWKNVLSRLEFRWDHSASGDNIYGPDDSNVLSATEGSVHVGSLKNSYILLANFVYKF